MPSIIKVDQIQSDQGFVNVSSNLQFSSGFTMRTPTLSSPTLTTPTTSGVMTLGAGIKFPATQVTDSDANTLDDYEEGTWTPTITTSSSGYVYSGQAGNYVKIGRFVWFSFQINISTVSSNGSGNFNIGGLPFVQGTNWGRYALQTSSVNFDGTAYDMYLYPDGGTGMNLLYSYDNGGWSVGTASSFPLSNGSILTAIGQYLSAS